MYFSAFLREANNSKTDTPFKSLLGENYKERFSEIKNRHFGIQHLVFVEKFDHNVFSALEETGWMVYHEDTRACELPQEICDIYMTLLASNISKAQGDLLETNQQYCENVFRNTDFQNYFKKLLPPQYCDLKEFKDISINFLFGNNESNNAIPIHSLLSIQSSFLC